MEIVKDLGKLKAIGKTYGLEFDSKYKYYIGDAYYNSNGQYLSFLDITYKGEAYDLKYFSGCFNPYLTKRFTDEA